MYSYGHQMFLTSNEKVCHAPVFCEKIECYKSELHAFAGIGVLHVVSCENTHTTYIMYVCDGDISSMQNTKRRSHSAVTQ